MKGDFILTITKQKRGHNEGNWIKIGANKWKVTITVGYNLEGRQVRRSKTGTKRECLEWFKKNKESSSNDFFYNYALKWLELRKPDLSPTTVRLLHFRINCIAKINNFKINKCNDSMIQLIVTELLKTKTEASTHNIISTLRQILTFARDRGDIDYIPYIPKIKTPPIKRTVEVPSIEKIKEILLLAKFKGGSLYPCILLGFLTGMRLGEMLALSTDDINLENSTLAINKTLILGENYKTYIKNGAKTNTSNRIIYITPIVLKEIYNSFNDIHFKKRKYTTNMSTKISKFFTDCGLSGFTAHSMRHVFVTLAQNYGVDYIFISQYVGHSIGNTTASVYTHCQIDKKNDKLDMFVSTFF